MKSKLEWSWQCDTEALRESFSLGYFRADGKGGPCETQPGRLQQETSCITFGISKDQKVWARKKKNQDWEGSNPLLLGVVSSGREDYFGFHLGVLMTEVSFCTTTSL